MCVKSNNAAIKEGKDGTHSVITRILADAPAAFVHALSDFSSYVADLYSENRCRHLKQIGHCTICKGTLCMIFFGVDISYS